MKAFLATFLLGSAAFAQEALPVDQPASMPAQPLEPAPVPVSEVAHEEGLSVIPQVFPRARYEATWTKNPFLLKVAAPVQVQESFAKDWALASMFNNQGKIRVTIQNKQTGETQRITNEGNSKSEFHLIKANFNRDRTLASAEIGRGSETAELKYDEALLAKPLTVSRGGAPGQPPVVGAARPMGGPPGVNNVAQMMQNRARAGLVMPGQQQPPITGSASPEMSAQGGVVAAPQMVAPGTNGTGGVDLNLGGVNPGQNVVPTAPAAGGAVPPTVSRRRLLIPPSAPTQ